jgi:NADH-quinone oxidoreductase subunit A
VEVLVNLRDYLPVVIFFLAGLAVGGAIFTLSKLGPRIFRLQRPNPTKALPYESGILTTRPARQRFSIDFYLTAMLFIVFDIELAFFYPLAVVLRDVGTAAVVELIVFVGVLGVALAYIWRKGALEWR